MTPTFSLPLDQASQIARFRRFLSIAIPFAAACALAAGLTFALLHDPIWIIVSGIIAGVVVTWTVALAYLRRGRLRGAVRWSTCGLLVAVVTMTIFVRGFIVVLVLPPILAVCIALTFSSIEDDLRTLMIVCGLTGTGVVVIDLFIPPLLPPASSLAANIIANVAVLFGFIIGSLWLFRQLLRATLRQLQAANHDLAEAQASLHRQVDERTASLQTVLVELQARSAEQARLLAEVEQQRSTIRELSVPVIPISATTLIMPLIGALDSERLRQLQDYALQALERSKARDLILDITGVPIVDSQVAQGLLAVVQAARLLGAEVILVGIRPEVAQAIVGLGLHLPDMHTYSDLQAALNRSAHQVTAYK